MKLKKVEECHRSRGELKRQNVRVGEKGCIGIISYFNIKVFLFISVAEQQNLDESCSECLICTVVHYHLCLDFSC